MKFKSRRLWIAIDYLQAQTLKFKVDTNLKAYH